MPLIYKIIISFLIFPSLIFGQSEKLQTIVVPTGSLGEISEVRKKMLEMTLISNLDDHFDIVPKDLFEEAQEKAFEELDYEECTEDQCIMMIKEILQVENSFQLVLMAEEGDTQISVIWNDLDKKRVEEEYCEGCKTKELRKSVSSLFKKLVGIKPVIEEKEESKKVESKPKTVPKMEKEEAKATKMTQCAKWSDCNLIDEREHRLKCKNLLENDFCFQIKRTENRIDFENKSKIKKVENKSKIKIEFVLSETVIDTSTGLMWQKKPDSNIYNWKNAIKYCDDLNLGFFSDWILPSINDLENILGKEKLFDTYKINYWYWSSTSSLNDAEAWHTGSNLPEQKKRESYKKLSFNVRCVRDSKNDKINFNTTGTKLIKINKNTITDVSANIMWEIREEEGSHDWWEAKIYCDNLNILNYSDWFLPDKEILENLFENKKLSDLLNKSKWYWSSSTRNINAKQYVWVMNKNGDWANGLKDSRDSATLCSRNL